MRYVALVEKILHSGLSLWRVVDEQRRERLELVESAVAVFHILCTTEVKCTKNHIAIETYFQIYLFENSST
ncbi:hypothetical protein GCM10009000_061580 [Halobacterium noricense]